MFVFAIAFFGWRAWYQFGGVLDPLEVKVWAIIRERPPEEPDQLLPWAMRRAVAIEDDGIVGAFGDLKARITLARTMAKQHLAACRHLFFYYVLFDAAGQYSLPFWPVLWARERWCFWLNAPPDLPVIILLLYLWFALSEYSWWRQIADSKRLIGVMMLAMFKAHYMEVERMRRIIPLIEEGVTILEGPVLIERIINRIQNAARWVWRMGQHEDRIARGVLNGLDERDGREWPEDEDEERDGREWPEEDEDGYDDSG
ncbi:Fc.00g003470.m01.CDS01 [Cosmosporella sp. VM-42]